MKILVVGSGGREHAIAWRLAQDAERHQLFCAPGNAGTRAVATNVDLKAEDITGIVAWAKAERPDLVVVGPEAPLVAGLVDALAAEGIVAFGPVAAGARLEGSKRFAKEVMDAAGVPTGKAQTFTDAVAAKAALADYGLPVVVKADGLAAGKGVIVAETRADAEAAIDDMLVANKFGAAGAEVLLEEFLHGEECSILALVDGERAVLLPSSQDHKRVFDGDKGPNTGGMGAYTPAPILPDDKIEEATDLVIRPVLAQLAKEDHPFTGILYAGLMMTADGPKVLEYNVRFGDPECQPLLMRLQSDLVDIMDACINGTLEPSLVAFTPKAALGVVVAAEGYPGKYNKGMPEKVEQPGYTELWKETVAREHGMTIRAPQQ